MASRGCLADAGLHIKLSDLKSMLLWNYNSVQASHCPAFDRLWIFHLYSSGSIAIGIICFFLSCYPFSLEQSMMTLRLWETVTKADHGSGHLPLCLLGEMCPGLLGNKGSQG